MNINAVTDWINNFQGVQLFSNIGAIDCQSPINNRLKQFLGCRLVVPLLCFKDMGTLTNVLIQSLKVHIMVR